MGLIRSATILFRWRQALYLGTVSRRTLSVERRHRERLPILSSRRTGCAAISATWRLCSRKGRLRASDRYPSAVAMRTR